MGVEMVIEVADTQAAQTVQRVLEGYQARLRADIMRTRRRLAIYEERYSVSITRFQAPSESVRTQAYIIGH